MEKPKREPTKESLEWAAQLWTRPKNEHRVMDVEFAVSIAVALDERNDR